MSKKLRILIFSTLVIILLAAIPLVAMAQDDDAVATVIVSNFSPDAPNIDIYIDGALLAYDMTFPSGTYPVEISAGEVFVEARYTDTEELLVSGYANLAPNTYYIIPIMNITERAQFGAYRLPLFAPMNTETDMRLQFFHAMPDAPRMDILNAETEEIVVPASGFGYVEDPYIIDIMPSGYYYWQMWTNTRDATGTVETPILGFDTGYLYLEPGAVHSFFFVGSPAIDTPILGLWLAMPYGGGDPIGTDSDGDGTPDPTSTPDPNLTATATSTPDPDATATPTATATTTTETTEIEADDDSEEASDDAWEEAYSLDEGVPFTITFTEEQIEAQINAAVDESSYSDSVGDVDVTLDNDLITLEFTYTVSGIVLDVKGTGTVDVTDDGGLTAEITSVTATNSDGDTVSIPDELLAVINDELQAALSGEEASTSTGNDVTFTEVVIDNGEIAISGYVTAE